MSLNFVFTIDGDWDEYFYSQRSEIERRPKKDQLIILIEREMALAKVIDGKFIHFVHTSPLVRDFFLQPEFIKLWQKLEKSGGEVGVHCHEEELYQAWHYDDQARMESAIGFLFNGLTEAGLTPRSYRGGFMTFSPKIIPILEEHGIFLDFSCEPGRNLIKNDQLISNWQGAASNVYRLSYDDHRQVGKSRVFEVPLGIYIERQSLFSIWQKARLLFKQSGTTIVSVLAHTYDFTSMKMRLKIKLALLILKRYGKFVDTAQTLNKIKEQGL
ncbi:MAG: hypothetical protein ABIH69_05240 [bacterium]|nr:hypothetical protein [Candidatus Margulisiibacteriota bacterium]